MAEELTGKDSLAAHLDAELHIDPDDVASPWTAAWASAVSVVGGALALGDLPRGLLLGTTGVV